METKLDLIKSNTQIERQQRMLRDINDPITEMNEEYEEEKVSSYQISREDHQQQLQAQTVLKAVESRLSESPYEVSIKLL